MTTHAHIALNAHLLSGEASYRSAGIHGYQANLLRSLPQVAPEFDFTAFVGAGNPAAHDRLAVRRASLPTQNPLMRIAWEQIAAPIVLSRLKPDLMHGLAFANPLLWSGPSVLTIHDLSFIRYPGRLSGERRCYLTWVTRASAHKAKRVIAVSESVKSEIVELLGVPADRIDVTLEGVLPDFTPQPHEEVEAFRAEYDLPERFILFLGTIEPRKNLDTLLRAYHRIGQRGEVKLVLAGGKGWQSEPIFALIEALDLTDDVVISGFMPEAVLPLLYSAAELFVYPSLYEGFGLPVAEAMACGTPVAVSDSTSLPEVVGEEGILLPPTDIDAWIEALDQLLNDKSTRDDLSERGLKRARLFTWNRTAHQTVKTYRRVLNTSRGETIYD
ncbi:MAG: glycosyltransferase family 4 protein [Anaerolineae bacterium]|nr:glycosyltransferase family 4 protein [Anaerolineae bacterium]